MFDSIRLLKTRDNVKCHDFFFLHSFAVRNIVYNTETEMVEGTIGLLCAKINVV